MDRTATADLTPGGGEFILFADSVPWCIEFNRNNNNKNRYFKAATGRFFVVCSPSAFPPVTTHSNCSGTGRVRSRRFNRPGAANFLRNML